MNSSVGVIKIIPVATLVVSLKALYSSGGVHLPLSLTLEFLYFQVFEAGRKGRPS